MSHSSSRHIFEVLRYVSASPQPVSVTDVAKGLRLATTTAQKGAIADALAELDEEDMRKKFFALKGGTYQQPIDEKHFMELWLRLQDLKVFFAVAAENMEAAVFTAQL